MVFVLLLSFAPLVETDAQEQSWNQNCQFENLDTALSVDTPRRRQRDSVWQGFPQTGLLYLIK